MKRIDIARALLLLVMITAMGALGCSGDGSGGATSDGLRIDLQVAKAPAGPVYLGGLLGDQYYNIDSFSTMNGNVIVARDEPLEPGMYILVLPDQVTNIQLLIDKDQEFTVRCAYPDVIGTIEIEGSTDNELFYESILFERTYQREYEQIRSALASAPEGSPQRAQLEEQRQAKVDERIAYVDGLIRKAPNSFFAKFKKAGQNPQLKDVRGPDGQVDRARQTALYLTDYWDEYDFSDARLLRTPVYSNKLASYFDRFLPQNADTIIRYADMLTRKSMVNDSVFKYTANYIGVKYQEPMFMGSDAVYTHMVRNFFTHDLAFWANEHEIDRLQQDAAIRYSCQIGRPAPDIEVTDPDGNTVSLLDNLDELLVLYIYTPECDNCRKETPQVKQIYDQWKNRGVTVFALCTDPDETIWKNYLSENNLDWVNAYDPGASSGYTFKYHIDITPEIYVINRDGIVVGKDLKAFQLPTIFERNL